MLYIRSTATLAYLVVEVEAGQEEDAYLTLSLQPGIDSIDFVDSPARLVVIVAADTEEQLSQRIVNAIELIGDIIVAIEVLPVPLPESVVQEERLVRA